MIGRLSTLIRRRQWWEQVTSSAIIFFFNWRSTLLMRCALCLWPMWTKMKQSRIILRVKGIFFEERRADYRKIDFLFFLHVALKKFLKNSDWKWIFWSLSFCLETMFFCFLCSSSIFVGHRWYPTTSIHVNIRLELPTAPYKCTISRVHVPHLGLFLCVPYFST